jgi:hypothetical protein
MKVRKAHIYDVDFPTRKKVNPNAAASKVAIHGPFSHRASLERESQRELEKTRRRLE